jgi:CHAT domain-containing protein
VQDHARPRLHWCPTGSFAFVPIHAAGIYEGLDRESCSDYVISSYTPTLTALIQAQRGVQTYAAKQTTLLLLAAERAHDANLPHLQYVPEEVQNVLGAATHAHIPSHLYNGPNVLESLSSANMVHLACHGIQDLTEPHRSHFSLTNGDLTVARLMETDLKHAFFAFLSACETARGDPKHADEVVHLASTMLFAGLKSIVATMWWVNHR